jgi:hypothetical protein
MHVSRQSLHDLRVNQEQGEKIKGRPVNIPGAVSLAEDCQNTAQPMRVNSSGTVTLMEPAYILGSTRVKRKK